MPLRFDYAKIGKQNRIRAESIAIRSVTFICGGRGSYIVVIREPLFRKMITFMKYEAH